MKAKITIIGALALLLVTSAGFAQKDMLIHKNVGKDVKMIVTGVDSITFQDAATPGTLVFDSYTDTAVGMEGHSKLIWSASYKGSMGGISGAFEEIDADLLFDETNPANIKFDGKVRLSTITTFEPGRDGPGHCVYSSLGVKVASHDEITAADTLISTVTGDTTFIAADTSSVWDEPIDSTDWAMLSAKAGDVVHVGGNVYKAKADFTYRGATGPVDVVIEYVGTYKKGANDLHCFEASFDFPAGESSSDNWYAGSNIKSTVTCTIHLKFLEEL